MEYFLIVVYSILLVYVSGFVITSLFRLSSMDVYESFIVKIIAGLVSLVFIYSVVKTAGNTVNLIIVIPLIVFLIYLRPKIDSTPGSLQLYSLKQIRMEMEPLAITLIFSSLWFLWQYSLYTNNLTGDPVYGPNGDSFFYIDIARSLKESGAENTNIIKNFLFNESKERVPYHYFELWISAGISAFSGVSVSSAFLIIVPVLFFAFNSILIYSLGRTLNLHPFLLFLSPALIFFIPFIIQYPGILTEKFRSYLGNYIYSYISILKLLIYLFFILGVIFFYFKNKPAAVAISLLLPAVTFTSVPAVMGLVCIYLLYQLKSRAFSKNWPIIITTFLIIAFLGFYYRHAFSSQNDGVNAVADESGYIKTIINIIGGTFLQVLYLYTPYFILLLILARLTKQIHSIYSKEHVQLYIYFIFAFICGIGAWSLIHRQLNSYQFFSNFFISSMLAIFILQSLHISSAMQKVKKLQRIFYLLVLTSFLIFCGIWNYNNHVDLGTARKPYSRKFYEKVNQVLNNSSVNNKMGVCFYSDSDYKKDPYIVQSLVHWPVQIFKLKHEKFYVVSLSDPFRRYDDLNDIDRTRNELSKKNSVFSIWLQKRNFTDSNITKSASLQQLAFIRENSIRFGIASATAILPSEIAAIKENEIADSITGYRFFLLKAD